MPPIPPWLRLPWVQGLLLCGLTAAAYSGVVQAGFVFDDYALVAYNESIRSLGSIPSFFAQDLWASADTQVASGYYRPLMSTSLALDWRIAGDAPWAYHLHSLGWHLLAVFALHRLLLALTRPLPALLGAGLFALHPLQSEAVVWISARNDLMAAALLLLALLLLRPVDASRWRLGLGGALALCAVLSKESALLLPLFLLSLDLAEHGRPRGWPRHALLWAAVGLHLAARSLAGVNAAASPPAEGWRLLGAKLPHLVATVGGLLAWPWPLSVGRDLASWGLGPSALVAGLLAFALAVLGLLLTRQRLVVVGLVWAAMGLAPSVLAVADKGLFGERYLYLGLAGLGLALAGAASGARVGRRRWLGLSLLFALPWCLVIQLRVRDWTDDGALWRAALRDTPCSYVEASLGHVHYRDGDWAAGVDMFMRALNAEPPRLEVCPRVVDLAGKLGSAELAVRVTEEAFARGCDFGDNPGKLAVYLASAGRWEDAAEVARRAEPTDPRGRARLVLATWDLVAGECSRYHELRTLWQRDDMDDQMQHLLSHGGYPELGLLVAAGRACQGPSTEPQP
jgi:hypothetical protein